MIGNGEAGVEESRVEATQYQWIGTGFHPDSRLWSFLLPMIQPGWTWVLKPHYPSPSPYDDLSSISHLIPHSLALMMQQENFLSHMQMPPLIWPLLLLLNLLRRETRGPYKIHCLPGPYCLSALTCHGPLHLASFDPRYSRLILLFNYSCPIIKGRPIIEDMSFKINVIYLNNTITTKTRCGRDILKFFSA